MSLTKGEVLELVQKETNGWWLVKKGGTEGWAPADYLQEVRLARSSAGALVLMRVHRSSLRSRSRRRRRLHRPLRRPS
jgi:uncharacterized protein YgiM (DUF1202 family)